MGTSAREELDKILGRSSVQSPSGDLSTQPQPPSIPGNDSQESPAGKATSNGAQSELNNILNYNPKPKTPFESLMGSLSDFGAFLSKPQLPQPGAFLPTIKNGKLNLDRIDQAGLDAVKDIGKALWSFGGVVGDYLIKPQSMETHLHTQEFVEGLVRGAHEFSKDGLLKGAAETVAGVAGALTRPLVKDVPEILWGTDIHTGKVATPEQLADNAKDISVNAMMILATEGAASVSKNLLAKLTVPSISTKVATLRDLVASSGPSFLQRRAINLSSGLAGATAAGFVQGNTTEERMGDVGALALIALPLGEGMSLLHKPEFDGSYEKVRQKAAQALTIRQIQDVAAKSPQTAILSWKGLASDNNFLHHPLTSLAPEIPPSYEHVPEIDAHDLVNNAASKAYYLTSKGTGFELRNIYDNKVIQTGDIGVIKQFLDGTLPANGPEQVPMEDEAKTAYEQMTHPKDEFGRAIVREGNPDVPNHLPLRPFEVPNIVTKQTLLGAFGDALARIPGIDLRSDYFKAMDNKYNLTSYNDILDALRNQKKVTMAEKAKVNPYLEGIMSLAKGMNQKKLYDVTRALQAATPDEIRDEMSSKPMSKEAVGYSNWLKDNEIDIDKVYRYLRDSKKIRDKLADPETSNNARNKLNQLHADMQNSYGMDQAHLKAADLFEAIKDRSPNDMTLNQVTHYARAIIDPTNFISRDDFIKKNKLDGQQVALVNRLQAFYEMMGPKFGIDQNRLLKFYMPHFKMTKWFAPDDPYFMQRNTLPREMSFISSKIRSGELENDLLEDDPVMAAIKYTNQGFNNQYFNDTRKQVVEQIGIQAQKIKLAGGDPTRFTDNANDFVNRLTYNGDAINSDMTNAFNGVIHEWNKMMPSDKLMIKDKDLNKIADNYLRLTSSALLGYRPALGFRHFMQLITNGGSRFNMSEVGRGLISLLDKDVRADLDAKGIGARISQLEQYDPQELETSTASGLVKKVEDLGFKITGLAPIFNFTYRAMYMGRYLTIADAMKEFQDGKINNEQFSQKISLDSHDQSEIKEFESRHKTSPEEATHYLADKGAKQVVFDYGLGIHPTGWGTIPGKLLTQFGTWPLNQARFMARLAGRGSAKNRAWRVAKMAAMSTAIYQAGKATGTNLYGWTFAPSFFYHGGPITGSISAIQMAFGEGTKAQQDFGKRLLQYQLGIKSEDNEITGWDPTNMIKMYVPGGSEAVNIGQTVDLLMAGADPITAFSKLAGVPLDPETNQYAAELYSH